MRKYAVFILVFGLVISVILVLIPLLTAQSNFIKIDFTHSHTKAFCNSENLCQDYEIVCNGENVVSISPITGAVVQFAENWKDPRNEEIKNRLC